MKYPMRWSKYTLPNGRECLLTQRPDSADPDSVFLFLKEKKPIVRFQFTDDKVVMPHRGPPYHWYPWPPRKNLTLENIYAFLILMDEYVKSTKKGPIWLHCDSSSMRAPTHFGIYLATHYPNEIMDICEGMQVHPTKDYDYAQYSRADKYLSYSIARDPGVKEFIDYWKRDPSLAYLFYMDEEDRIKWRLEDLEESESTSEKSDDIPTTNTEKP